jgi:hypothetical protein
MTYRTLRQLLAVGTAGVGMLAMVLQTYPLATVILLLAIFEELTIIAERMQ